MPTLPTVVSEYIDGVTLALREGADVGYGLKSAGRNFLRTQDLATILELLQEATGAADVAVVSGTTTEITVTSAPVNGYVGATLTFAADTTTVALQGVTATVLSNTATVLTLAEALAEAPVAGDVFSVTNNIVTKEIYNLRGGKPKGDTPANGEYTDNHLAMDALEKFLNYFSSTLPVTTISRVGAKTGTGSTTDVIVTKDTYRVDELRDLVLTIGAENRKIVSNRENKLVVTKAFTAAPAEDVAYTVTRVMTDPNFIRANMYWPGGLPGENLRVAEALELCKEAVVAFVVPT